MLPRRCLMPLARLMLAGFVLALTVTVLAPLVQPRAWQWVCSADGQVRLLVDAGDGGLDTARTHALDCVLCLPAGAPPSVVSVALPPASPLASTGWPWLEARTVVRASAPLPPRGPPLHS